MAGQQRTLLLSLPSPVSLVSFKSVGVYVVFASLTQFFKDFVSFCPVTEQYLLLSESKCAGAGDKSVHLFWITFLRKDWIR